MPDQPDALDLLADNGPLAVSSANITGQPPATTARQAQDMLGESVDVYLDGGPTPGSLPSTIVDCTGDALRVVRVGVVSVQALRDVVSDLEAPADALADDSDDSDGSDGSDGSDDDSADGGQDPGRA
jgi:tRNA A37 threonylcarbamoyladenosine synthetase subunit TsaC/SUA5/YrdC